MGKDRIPVSEGEYRFIERAAKTGFKEGTVEEASRVLGIDKSAIESIARLLADKGLAEVSVEESEKWVLSDRGKAALREGLPEEKLLELILAGEVSSAADAKRVLGDLGSIGIGNLVKLGIIKIVNGKIELVREPDEALAIVESLKGFLHEVNEKGVLPRDSLAKILVKRGLVRKEKIKQTIIRFKEDPSSILNRISLEVARLNHRLLKTGEWKRVLLRGYDVTASPPKTYPARVHFLTEFIEMLRDLMKELGFREVEGPIVEAELYNFDLLFQPQDHPAREIHDTLWVKPSSRALELPQDLLERARLVHERSWKYKWSPEIAARLVLRSQTTSVSARVLASRPRPPLRVFTIGKVYRSDVVDATHLPEFHQLDGLDGEPGYTFRDLLGILEEISERLGFRVKFKPGYFPFTEPSVEGYVRLPSGKWLELFGAGMMRPEVLEIAGVDYPVGAWGFGVERLAAAYYGLSDIRQLYSRNINFIREFPKKI